MTAPKPPETESFIAWGIKERDAAALRLRSVHLTYHSAGLLLLVLLGIGGRVAYKYHERKLARLEAQAQVEQVKATNEHKLGEAWKARAISLTDSVRVDTVQVRKLIRSVKVDTLMVPVVPAPAQDGVTYSEPQTVPMEVVSKLAFDSLGAACTRVEHDCGAALAAKDSVIAHMDSARAALVALNANVGKQLVHVKRASFWAKWGYAIAGVVIGRVTASIR